MDNIHEQPHKPGDHEFAQESWYFNWTDPRHDMFGLARIGYKYNAQQPEPLILIITGNGPELIFPLEDIPKMTDSYEKIDAAKGLVAGKMTATMEEPYKRWRIQLNSKNSMDLLFESYTPVFNYHESGRKLASTMTTEHFEQSCRVTGWLNANNKRFEINGLGQRDKSWGIRIWPEILGWDWIAAQFNEEITFNVMRTLENDQTFVNGFIYRDQQNYAITDATISYEWGSRDEEPAKARFEITDETGTVHLITSITKGICPIPKPPVQLEEAYSIFTYHGENATLEGGGVVEHVWRP